jgi:hypothetical protein
MNKEQIFGFSSFTNISSWCNKNGYISDGMVAEITGSIIAIVGIWSVLSKKKEVEVK